jgi:hypothetical protein
MRPVWHSILIAAVLLAHSGSADAAWVVDADGACVERWASSDLLRGPAAIVNAPLLPVRTLAGGAGYAWNNEEWWPWQVWILGPAVTLFSAAVGAVEGAWWIGTGVVDTLSGGYFAVAPERATHLSVRPDVPRIIADAEPTPAPQDPCGRPR